MKKMLKPINQYNLTNIVKYAEIILIMHFALRWPSRLGRQTHRVVSRRGVCLRHLEVAGSDPVRSIYTRS